MPRNALEVSIAAAERAHRQLAKIIARLGTKAHPRGRILTAYNKARRELKKVLDNPVNGNVQRAQVQRILQTLEAEVQSATLEALQSGVAVGNELIQTQTAAYGFTVPPDEPSFEFVALGTETVLEEFRQQESSVLALIAAGVLSSLIVGDNQRQGVLRPAPIIREATTQATRANTVTFDNAYTQVQQAQESIGEPIPARVQKILIATLDDRTTDTCIVANGQIRDFDEPFRLTETPRYADLIMQPPFHDFCRSVPAIYDPVVNEGQSEELREQSGQEMARREAEKARRVERQVARIAETIPTQEPAIYRRSKTIEEAEAWARGAGVDAKYTRVGEGNTTNRIIADMQARGIAIDARIRGGDAMFAEKPGLEGAYRPSDNTVFINPNPMTPARARQLERDGVFSDGGLFGSRRHELLHSANRNAPNVDGRLTSGQSIVASEVSRYATTDRREFLAEYGTGVLAGKSYSDDVMRLYRVLGGVEIGDRP